MIIYATEIHSDIKFPLQLPNNGTIKYKLNLSAHPPEPLTKSLCCGRPFHQTHGRKVFLYSDNPFDINRKGQPWCYEVQNVVSFYWWGGESTIYYTLGKSGNNSLLSFWFIHLLLPLFYTIESMYEFLHGGAVNIDGKAVFFIAPSMGGKSTLTDYFIRQGHELIADDKLPTFIRKKKSMISASHPYHRPYRKPEELGIHTENFTLNPKPIQAIYLLNKGHAKDNVTITEISGFRKFNALSPSFLYMFDFLKEKRLSYLASLTANTPVFNITIPWNTERISEVHQHITAML